jgi:hypothetical protein
MLNTIDDWTGLTRRDSFGLEGFLDIVSEYSERQATSAGGHETKKEAS